MRLSEADSLLLAGVLRRDNAMGAKAAQFLVDRRGANVNVEDGELRTPLHYACYAGGTELVRFFVQRGANVNAQDINGRTPLHWACAYGHLELIGLLTKNGASMDTLDKDGRPPSSYAKSKAARVLFMNPSVHTNVTKTRSNTTPTAPSSPESSLDSSETSSRSVRGGSFGEDAAVAGAGDGAHGGSTGQESPVSSSEEEASPTAAAGTGNVQVREPDQLLFDAVMRGEVMGVHAVEFLLDRRGASVHARDADLRTPLHYACYMGSRDLAAVFIRRGADIDARDGKGRTPAHWACACGQVELVDLLMTHGASMDTLDNEGHAPANYTQAKALRVLGIGMR